MDFLKRLRPQKPVPNPHEGKFIICPSAASLYIDTDGKPCEVESDTIAKRDYLWVRDSYSVILPGLKEWCERYRRAVDPMTHAVSAGFDWRGWHHDGLLFTREIYRKLPKEITLRYARPPGDESGLVEDFDVSLEVLDQLLEQLGHVPYDRGPVITDNVVVGVRAEEDNLSIRLKTKGTYETFTFSHLQDPDRERRVRKVGCHLLEGHKDPPGGKQAGSLPNRHGAPEPGHSGSLLTSAPDLHVHTMLAVSPRTGQRCSGEGSPPSLTLSPQQIPGCPGTFSQQGSRGQAPRPGKLRPGGGRPTALSCCPERRQLVTAAPPRACPSCWQTPTTR